jgi:large subunit ribosomal protein L4
MKLDVLNIEGAATGKQVDLPEGIFGVEPNEHAVYLAVKLYNANQRQGTHKAKTRSEVAGSTRKLHKQKGTGGSRKGDIKSPVFRGGGRIFGPEPRDYTFSLNKKVKKLAKLSVLSVKAAEGAIMVVEDFSFDSPKTKQFVGIMSKLNVADQKAILVLGGKDENIFKSSRNLAKSSVITTSDLNTYSIINSNKLIFSESGLRQLIEELN